MNTLPSTIAPAYNPRTNAAIGLIRRNKPYNCKSSSVKIHIKQSITTTTSTSSVISRREAAVALGFCFTPFPPFLDPQHNSAAAEAAAGNEAACEFTAASSGLEYCDKVIGTGPEPVKGQLIKAHYVGKLENGKVFDSSYDRGKPLTFRVGVGEVIKGWDEGILGGAGIPAMSAGGKRKLRIPPALGYGVRGAGCRGGSCIIPPDSLLLFDVEFLGKV